MAPRRQVASKLREAYLMDSKAQCRILDRVVETTGMVRSTARRLLSGPRLPDPRDQIDGALGEASPLRRRRVVGAGVDADGGAGGKHLVVMRDPWLPLLAVTGDRDKPSATRQARDELVAMSAATIDRYLAPARPGTG